MSRNLRVIAQARVGQRVRKWILDRLIDVGGMAAVYAATHRNGNEVAIKVLHPQYAEMEEARERFLREGYAANKVKHPNVVAVLDDDELSDGTPFLVMELLKGQPLETRLQRQGVLPPQEILFIAHEVLSALAAGHAEGIIHRDIKPPNIFLTELGEVKVLDYGLARMHSGPDGMSMTRTGTVIGTASFMAPEQARGKTKLIDHRVDIWSVGATIFRGLTGRNVHTERHATDLLLAAMTNHAPKLKELLPEIHDDLAEVVDKALAFQKADRWPDAVSMQRAVRAVYEGGMGEPLPQSRQASSAASWAAPASTRTPGASVDLDDIHVSVMLEEPEDGDSIFVQIDDGSGASRPVTLRKKGSCDADDLEEVSVIIDDD